MIAESAEVGAHAEIAENTQIGVHAENAEVRSHAEIARERTHAEIAEHAEIRFHAESAEALKNGLTQRSRGGRTATTLERAHAEDAESEPLSRKGNARSHASS